MSSLSLIFTILAAASSGAVGTIRSAIRTVFGAIRSAVWTVLSAIGSFFDFLFAPIDRAFEPVAGAFNNTIGNYVGEVTGFQLFFLLFSFLTLGTAGIWGSGLIVFEPGEGLYALDIRRTLALASIWAVFAMGWDIQSGYTGYISFGHSALSGGAAYATALLLNEVSTTLPFYVTAPISVLAAVVIGLLIALPSLRLQGPYFSLITFAAVLLFYQATLAVDILGGSAGLRVNRLVPPGNQFLRYYMLFIPMIVIAIGLTVLARSNYGLIFTAIRENEDAVSAAGINPTKFKIWSFVLSSIVMGIGGVMLVSFYSNADPNTFVVVNLSIEMIAMAVLGGIATILGAMGGAFVFFFLKDVLLGLLIDDSHLRLFILFLIVVAILVFARDGLFRKLWHRLGRIRGDDS